MGVQSLDEDVNMTTRMEINAGLDGSAALAQPNPCSWMCGGRGEVLAPLNVVDATRPTDDFTSGGKSLLNRSNRRHVPAFEGPT